MSIDPSNLQPLLLEIGFSYFDVIKTPHPKEAFQRTIILCSKSYGATPAAIRNGLREEAHDWGESIAPYGDNSQGPPPVRYDPVTPIPYYNPMSPSYSPFISDVNNGQFQPEVVSTTIISPREPNQQDCSPGEATPLIAPSDDLDPLITTSVVTSAPDSTSGHQ